MYVENTRKIIRLKIVSFYLFMILLYKIIMRYAIYRKKNLNNNLKNLYNIKICII